MKSMVASGSMSESKVGMVVLPSISVGSSSKGACMSGSGGVWGGVGGVKGAAEGSASGAGGTGTLGVKGVETGGGGGVTAGSGGVWGLVLTGAPQLVQKRTPSGSCLPQWIQNMVHHPLMLWYVLWAVPTTERARRPEGAETDSLRFPVRPPGPTPGG